MSEMNGLLARKEEILSKISEIEENCEGIKNDNNAKKVSELNAQRANLSAVKTQLQNKLKAIEGQIQTISKEINGLSGTGSEKILQAIKEQRWYFFKNKPKVLMDRDTGLLWANLDYFNYKNNNHTYGITKATAIIKDLEIDNYKNWRFPSAYELWDMIEDKSFPFKSGTYWKIKDCDYWYVSYNNEIRTKDLDNDGATSLSSRRDSYLLPCNSSLTTEDYKVHVSKKSKVFSEKERLQLTLTLFVTNGLKPIFKSNEVTELYKKIYIEKPLLLEKLNEVENHINSLQQVTLLSSSFDFQSILAKYDLKSISQSIIQYYSAVISVIDELMEKLQYYEEAKSDIIRDFNVISLTLSKKYEDNPNFTNEENALLKNRQAFFKKHFELGMESVTDKLLAIKRQAEMIEEKIDTINSGENPIQELAAIEKEERACFQLIVENAARIIKNALQKIEFFEGNKRFAANAVALWETWSEDYKVFKTTLKHDLKVTCEDDGIESDVYNAWFSEWQKKRFIVEERFLPIIAYGLKGNLLKSDGGEPTIIEKLLGLLDDYKKELDNFYLEERKSIHTKCFFQVTGELQEKFETESELFKVSVKLQKQLQQIIFSLDKTEDKLFLLKWADTLLNLQIDEVLDFVKDKEISKISNQVLTEFADLKQKNFKVYISDSKAYGKELQRRENEYNALIFKMRKDLIKQ